jgi:hypothetical protein
MPFNLPFGLVVIMVLHIALLPLLLFSIWAVETWNGLLLLGVLVVMLPIAFWACGGCICTQMEQSYHKTKWTIADPTLVSLNIAPTPTARLLQMTASHLLLYGALAWKATVLWSRSALPVSL